MISVRQLHPCFVGEISGADLTNPVDWDTFHKIEAWLDRFAVLIFRAQRLQDEQQIAFSKLFGPRVSAGAYYCARSRPLMAHL
jgi:alpha-ketoglutarate-dependent 2,4-dichlorophenoxyacetate dioxygenase